MDKIQERVKRAYQSGFGNGLQRGMGGEKYPDGIDWHIIGTSCICMTQTLPVADNAGEDIFLFEEMSRLRENKCDGCGKYRKVFYEDGNMASKKEGWKPKE